MIMTIETDYLSEEVPGLLLLWTGLELILVSTDAGSPVYTPDTLSSRRFQSLVLRMAADWATTGFVSLFRFTPEAVPWLKFRKP